MLKAEIKQDSKESKIARKATFKTQDICLRDLFKRFFQEMWSRDPETKRTKLLFDFCPKDLK